MCVFLGVTSNLTITKSACKFVFKEGFNSNVFFTRDVRSSEGRPREVVVKVDNILMFLGV